MNDGKSQIPRIVPLSNFVPKGFGFVHHAIAILYHQVPNPKLISRFATFSSLYARSPTPDAGARSLKLPEPSPGAGKLELDSGIVQPSVGCRSRPRDGMLRTRVAPQVKLYGKKYGVEVVAYDAGPLQAGALQGGFRRAAERRHPTNRERMGSPTLQTLQDPILMLPWVCFRGAFQTQNRDTGPLQAGDLVWLETPRNPCCELVDVAAVAAACAAAAATLAVDATFAPPPLQV